MAEGNRHAVLEYAHFEDCMDWHWSNFTPREMACRGTGRLIIVPSFMDLIQSIRTAMNFPFIVTSGYRTPEYNQEVSTTGPDGPHTTGQAIDIHVYGERAVKLVRAAIAYGMTGIGVQQKGPYKSRFLHLDNLTEAEYRGPRPHIWSY